MVSREVLRQNNQPNWKERRENFILDPDQLYVVSAGKQVSHCTVAVFGVGMLVK